MFDGECDSRCKSAMLSLLVRIARCDGFMCAKESVIINDYINSNNIEELDFKRLEGQSERELCRMIGKKQLLLHKNLINKLILADKVIHPNEENMIRVLIPW